MDHRGKEGRHCTCSQFAWDLGTVHRVRNMGDRYEVVAHGDEEGTIESALGER